MLCHPSSNHSNESNLVPSLPQYAMHEINRVVLQAGRIAAGPPRMPAILNGYAIRLLMYCTAVDGRSRKMKWRLKGNLLNAKPNTRLHKERR